jgi:hypothetical protein
MSLARRASIGLLFALVVSACATSRPAPVAGPPAAPRFAAYPTPDIPATLAVDATMRLRHEGAWNRRS